MAQNPLEQAHKLGLSAGDELARLFGRFGNTAHPNSEILIAYRAANRSLREVVRSGGNPAAAREVTRQLRATVSKSARGLFGEAAQAGVSNAKAQLKAYGIRPQAAPDPGPKIDAAYEVIQAKLQAQEAALQALLLSGADEGLILGDEARRGILGAAEIITAGVFWAASLFGDLFGGVVEDAAPEFQKQAIAALDGRTTDCCLRVTGQVQPLNSPFHLTGTPRFADYLDWPPFHHWCRTSVVLYQAAYDDGITDRLRESADFWLAQRAAGRWPDQHPADAFA